MNLPNKLTVARFVLTIVLVVLFYLPVPSPMSWAWIVFFAASVTDYIDGQIARRRNLVTDFGKLMDPLADKILISAALVLLSAQHHDIPAWAVVIVLAREFFVTGIRMLALQKGAVLAAERLGKHKAFWQMVTAAYYLLAHAVDEPLFHFAKPAVQWKWFSPSYFGEFCIVMMTALTVISGASYFWKNRGLFMHGPQG
jgi:CDP-diacylglycerol---glycerol-3-phosphate 3-phosphatidyltransferase